MEENTANTERFKYNNSLSSLSSIAAKYEPLLLPEDLQF